MTPRESNVIAKIIGREGGYVDRAEDRGGPTNFGITISTLSEFAKSPATPATVKSLDRATAETIYYQRYMVGPGFTAIADDRLFELVVDTAVNNGRARAIGWLQRSLGQVEDGILGPVTLAHAAASPRRAYWALIALRMKKYGALISANHSQAVFAGGWLNRLAEFVHE
jgi:lysozyme family protein